MDWRQLMRGFNQDIPCVGERKQMPLTQSTDKIRCNIIVRPGNQVQWNAGRTHMLLQLLGRLTDLLTVVVIESGKDMRRARHTPNPLSNIDPGHCH